jgi:hypothetical protein
MRWRDAGCSDTTGEADFTPRSINSSPHGERNSTQVVTIDTRSADQETRILRARHANLAGQVDRAIEFGSPGTPRRLVQIYNGGSMSSSPDHFFLGYPIELDGAEAEGGTGTPVIDASQTIVVDVLGHAPAAGDILTAYAVGGRWVAERAGSGSGGSLACSPCKIPAQNLTLSWVNVISGNGSTTLTFASTPTTWTSACSNGLLYELFCTGGQVELRVIFFTAGSCPTGTQQYCSNLRVTPYGLTLSSYTCAPFSMTFLSQLSSCPSITSSGYTQFTITL